MACGCALVTPTSSSRATAGNPTIRVLAPEAALGAVTARNTTKTATHTGAFAGAATADAPAALVALEGKFCGGV